MAGRTAASSIGGERSRWARAPPLRTWLPPGAGAAPATNETRRVGVLTRPWVTLASAERAEGRLELRRRGGGGGGCAPRAAGALYGAAPRPASPARGTARPALSA